MKNIVVLSLFAFALSAQVPSINEQIDALAPGEGVVVAEVAPDEYSVAKFTYVHPKVDVNVHVGVRVTTDAVPSDPERAPQRLIKETLFSEVGPEIPLIVWNEGASSIPVSALTVEVAVRSMAAQTASKVLSKVCFAPVQPYDPDCEYFQSGWSVEVSPWGYVDLKTRSMPDEKPTVHVTGVGIIPSGDLEPRVNGEPGYVIRSIAHAALASPRPTVTVCARGICASKPLK